MRTSVQRSAIACVLSAVLWMASGRLAGAQETAKRAITFDDLIAMHRVAEPNLSSDGKWVA